MRLIDADALMEWVEKEAETKRGLSVDNVLDAIDNATTIDPVKRGMWIPSVDEHHICYIECSVCGFKELELAGRRHLHYCPECGAHLYGGEE